MNGEWYVTYMDWLMELKIYRLNEGSVVFLETAGGLPDKLYSMR